MTGIITQLKVVEDHNAQGLLSFLPAYQRGGQRTMKEILNDQGIKNIYCSEKKLSLDNVQMGKLNLFHIMCYLGDQATLATLHNDFMNIKSIEGEEKYLTLAIMGNHPEIMSSLIQSQGIDINAKDQRGMTALHHTGQLGRIECMKILLKNKAANAFAVTKGSNTFLHLAVRHYNAGLYKRLYNKTGDNRIKCNELIGKYLTEEEQNEIRTLASESFDGNKTTMIKEEYQEDRVQDGAKNKMSSEDKQKFEDLMSIVEQTWNLIDGAARNVSEAKAAIEEKFFSTLFRELSLPPKTSIDNTSITTLIKMQGKPPMTPF